MEALLGLVRHKGNAALFSAVEMSVLSTLAGVPLHLHAEGLRGTGKTSILRAARHALPRIRRVRGCLYNCDPAAPHCPEHRHLAPGELERLGTEWVPMPFLEISHSAKVGTVVGSIDLGRLVNAAEPAAALLPGTLPQAHRGIVFVDEINRLAETAPELADVLLDAMGTRPGRVQIEETGLPPVEMPLVVSVWAASNPDEDPGPLEEIRRQLSDRFDFVIPTARPEEPSVVEAILSALEGDRRPAPPVEAGAEAQRARFGEAAGRLAGVRVPAWLRSEVAALYTRFGLESLRAPQAILWGVRLAACLAGRQEANWEDLALVAPLALQHRVEPETLGRIVQHLQALPVPRTAGAAGAQGGTQGIAPGGEGRQIAGAAAGLPVPAAGGSAQADARAPAPPADSPPAPPAGAAPATPGPAGSPGAAQRQAGTPARRRDHLPLWQRLCSWVRRGAARPGMAGAGPARGVDPARHPPEAPPHRARPLRTLPESRLVYTEQDLRRGRPGR